MSSSSASSTLSAASRQGDAPLWLTALAKFGYAARGVIYVIIGVLALMQAGGFGGSTEDSKGAIESLQGSGWGLGLIWFIAIGLIGYSLWRLTQSVLDADGHGTDGSGVVIRGALFTSAITHAGLAFYAVSLATGADSGGSSGDSKQGLVAMMLGWPGGKWIAMIAGGCIIGAGIAHAVKAHKEKYEKHFVIDRDTMKKIAPICKFGLYARSVVFTIIGSLMIYAAWTQSPETATGLAGVLDKIEAFGSVLLGVIAAGLLCFGLYSIFEAFYRKIDKPDSLDPTEKG